MVCTYLGKLISCQKNKYIMFYFFLFLVLIAMVWVVFFQIYRGLSSTSRELFSSLPSRNLINPVILQVTKNYQPSYVIQMVKRCFPSSWSYLNFTDQECLTYFRNHPLTGFENIETVFRKLRGPFRADLFRYYFLYLQGGVFMDGDFMLEQRFSHFYRGEDFVSIKTFHKKRQAIFNGFIITKPRSPILLDALKKLCQTPMILLRFHYLKVCEDLFDIVQRYKYVLNIKIYQEIMNGDIAYTNDDYGNLLSCHYWKYKYGIMLEDHDNDPFERNHKRILAKRLRPFFDSIMQTKKVIILFACGTAYFESILLETWWDKKTIILVEDPIVVEYKKDVLKNIHPHAMLLEGSLSSFSIFLENFSTTTADIFLLSLNPNVCEPFDLWNDILKKFHLDYFMISFPYMGKYGMPCLFTTSIYELEQCPCGKYVSIISFMEGSGLEHNLGKKKHDDNKSMISHPE